MVTFQNANSLIGRVKETLSSYDSVGLIDEGKFYYLIKEALSDIGLDVMQPAKAILTVERNKVAIPCDMVEFYSIHRCTQTSQAKKEHHLQSEYTWYIQTDKCDYSRAKCCDIEEEGEKITQRVYINAAPADEVKFQRKGLLRYNPMKPTSKNLCHTASPCRKATNTNDFYYDGNYFYFDFDNDSILLNYYAFPMEDGLPLVPNETIVQRFIEKKLIFETLKYIWYNSEADKIILQKMQFAEKELGIAFSDAQHWARMPSFKELLAWKQSQISNFAPYEFL